jgi:hypothetical protein
LIKVVVARVALFFVPGSLAVAYMLFGTRWISYVGTSPFFLTDIFVGLGIASGCLAYWRNRSRFSSGASILLGAIPLLALLLWAAVRFMIGITISVDAFRDLAPYAYVVMGLVGLVGVITADQKQLKRSFWLLYFCLLGHGVWVLFASLFSAAAAKLPVINGANSIRLFTMRGDIDTSYVGLLLALTLVLLLRTRKVTWMSAAYLAVIGFSWFIISHTDTRAGVLAAAVSLVAGIILAGSTLWRPRPSWKILVGVMAVVLAVSFVPGAGQGVFEKSSGGIRAIEKVIDSFDGTSVSPADSEVDVPVTSVSEGTGFGTTTARLNAWTTLTGWVAADQQRLVTGVGFGPNFMIDSGTAIALVGPDSPDFNFVRSPHNYLLGTTARLGLVGFFLVLIAGFAFTYALIRARWRKPFDNFTLVAALIPLCLLIPSQVGVILESPFGAIPFWWGVGATIAAFVRSKSPNGSTFGPGTSNVEPLVPSAK